MDAMLQEAIDALGIRDVYLRDSESYLVDGFEPKYDADLDAMDVQFQHVVTESSVLEVEDNGEVPARLFRVFIRLGARLVVPIESDDQPESELGTERASKKSCADVDDPSRVRALISAMLVAEYDLTGDPSADALKAFALRNASYHVWPYWREFLASQCVRMNLPKVVLPAVQFARRSETDPASQK